jgi:hypothetical protein
MVGDYHGARDRTMPRRFHVPRRGADNAVTPMCSGIVARLGGDLYAEREDARRAAKEAERLGKEADRQAHELKKMAVSPACTARAPATGAG